MKAYSTIIKVITFSIAMAYLESAVVVYLRKIYYPGVELFPLKVFDAAIGITELGREQATLIMLASIGWMCGKNRMQRFAYFMLSFAIWDIFYYVFLKLLIDWPASIFTFDILFLIPVTWVGPVLSPIIVSLNMIVFSFSILYVDEKYNGKSTATIKRKETLLIWSGFIIGALIILVSFMEDYTELIIQKGYLKDFFNLLSNKEFIQTVSTFVPNTFNWTLFLSGQAVWIISLLYFFKVFRSAIYLEPRGA